MITRRGLLKAFAGGLGMLGIGKAKQQIPTEIQDMPQSRSIFTLTNFTVAGNSYIVPNSDTVTTNFVLQGDTTGGGSWSTIPVTEYELFPKHGYICYRPNDLVTGAGTDWSVYSAFRCTYTKSVSGVRTTYSNVTATFTDSDTGYSPIGQVGEINGEATKYLFANYLIAAGATVVVDELGARFGNPPPVSSTSGTGVILNSTGMLGVYNDVLTFFLNAGAPYFNLGQGSVLGFAPSGEVMRVKQDYSTDDNHLSFTAIATATAGPMDSVQSIEGWVTTSHASGAIDLAIATIGNIEHIGAGTVTSSRAIQSGIIVNGGCGAITQTVNYLSAGVAYVGSGTAGTITNAYQFYASAHSGSAVITNKWAFYAVAGAGNSLMADGLVVGSAALATNATDGFLYIPACAGTPTGTPTSFTGRRAMVIDSSNNKMYIYSGGAWVALN